jgi:hypothetical protein
MAKTFLDTFFPPPALVGQNELEHWRYDQLPTEGLTLKEVEHAIYAAISWSAPSLDPIPAVVWQQLWPVTKEMIFSTFATSLRLGRVPKQIQGGQDRPTSQA